MSRAYTAGGKRRSSMTHAKYSWACTCGKTVSGNGGKSSHRKACSGRYLNVDEEWALSVPRYEAAHKDDA